MATDMATAGIVLKVILFIISAALGTLSMWLVAKLFKLKDLKLKTAFITAIAATTISTAIGLGISMAMKSMMSGAASPTSGLVAVALIGGAASLVVQYLTNSLAVKQFYKLPTGKSFLVGLVWSIINLVMSFIVTIIITAVLVGVLLGSGGIKP